jgi:hypothetical protein
MQYSGSISKWLHEHATLLHCTQIAYLVFFFCLVYSTTSSFNKSVERLTIGWFGSNELQSTQEKVSVLMLLL